MGEIRKKYRLTNRFIDSLKPPPKGQKLYWDDETTGFGVRVTHGTKGNPHGDKSYVVQSAQTHKRRTLGKCSIYSVEQARSLAVEMLQDLHEGKDPLPATRVARETLAITVEQAFQHYMDNRTLGELTRRDYLQLLNLQLADWKDRTVLSITPIECRDLHKRLTAHSAGRADYAMRVLRAVIEYVKATYRDPRTGVSLVAYNAVSESLGRNKMRDWNAPPPHRLVISGDDLCAWYKAVCSFHEVQRDGQPHKQPEVTRDYLLLLLLTGLRSGECARIKKADIDFKRKLLYIPAYTTSKVIDAQGKQRTRTKENNKARRDLALPLTDAHIEILKRRIDALPPDGEYIFPATGEKVPYISNRGKTYKAVSAMSKVAFTPHALRRTFITTAESFNLSSYAIKALVNHSLGKGDVTAGYIVMMAERLRSDMERIVDKLLAECGVKRTRARPRLRVAA